MRTRLENIGQNFRTSLSGGFWPNFWNDERGQSTTEYILILSVVVMIAMKFKSTFGSKLSTIVDKLGTQIDGATNEGP